MNCYPSLLLITFVNFNFWKYLENHFYANNYLIGTAKDFYVRNPKIRIYHDLFAAVTFTKILKTFSYFQDNFRNLFFIRNQSVFGQLNSPQKAYKDLKYRYTVVSLQIQIHPDIDQNRFYFNFCSHSLKILTTLILYSYFPNHQ